VPVLLAEDKAAPAEPTGRMEIALGPAVVRVGTRPFSVVGGAASTSSGSALSPAEATCLAAASRNSLCALRSICCSPIF
jgi:hypothetical protein